MRIISWFVTAAFGITIATGVGRASVVALEAIELPELVKTAPIIVVARYAHPTPEHRMVAVEAKSTAGKLTTVTFKADVWKFEPIEVLKNSGNWTLPTPFRAVSASLRRDFELQKRYVLEGTSKSPIKRYYQPKAEVWPDGRGEKRVIVFLRPSPNAVSAENRNRDTLARRFADAFPFSADIGLEGTKWLDQVRGILLRAKR